MLLRTERTNSKTLVSTTSWSSISGGSVPSSSKTNKFLYYSERRCLTNAWSRSPACFEAGLLKFGRLQRQVATAFWRHEQCNPSKKFRHSFDADQIATFVRRYARSG